MREPWECIASTGEVLDRLSSRWALIGALAAERYRVDRRLTTDADFLVEWVDGLVEAFEAEGYEVRAVAEPGESPHVVMVRGKGDRFDLLITAVEYQRVALARAEDHVITAEDVVVFKLIAWRAKDRDDIDSILRTGRELDATYIEHWAAEWEVLDRWEEARRAYG